MTAARKPLRPPPFAAEPAVEDADLKTSLSDASFDTVVLRGDANDNVSIDELRIGTTWTDVRARQELTFTPCVGDWDG